MKIICAWCHTVIDAPAGESDSISHGICQVCFVKQSSASGTYHVIIDERIFSDLVAGNVVEAVGYRDGREIPTLLYFSGRDFQKMRRAIDAAESRPNQSRD